MGIHVEVCKFNVSISVVVAHTGTAVPAWHSSMLCSIESARRPAVHLRCITAPMHQCARVKEVQPGSESILGKAVVAATAGTLTPGDMGSSQN